MTVLKSYTCNLCGIQAEPHILRGLWWTRSRWEEKKSDEATAHLCIRCIDDIKRIPTRNQACVTSSPFSQTAITELATLLKTP